ncbi:MAG: DUF72 domain-containing protein [Myxococcales bacterium]
MEVTSEGLEVSRILVGTSGFAFDRWQDSGFYPRWARRPPLESYARHFGFVEVDSTFYRPPRPETFARWRDAVPPGFRFSLKVPREITHQSGPAQAAERLRSFLLDAAELEGKLAALLLQFPPRRAVDVPLLDALLQAIPAGLRAAFEFRHPSWFTPSIARRLLACGKTFCATSAAMVEVLPHPGWIYVRLPGTHFSRSQLGRLRSTLPSAAAASAFVVFRDQARLPFPRDAWLFRLLVSRASAAATAPPDTIHDL